MKKGEWMELPLKDNVPGAVSYLGSLDDMEEVRSPRYGIRGVRTILQVKNRWIFGAKVSDEETAEAVWENGGDVVVDVFPGDDFEKRFSEFLERADRAEEETGERKMYIPNISAPYPSMVERAQVYEDLGGTFVYVHGEFLSAIQGLFSEGFTLGIYAGGGNPAVLRALGVDIVEAPVEGVLPALTLDPRDLPETDRDTLVFLPLEHPRGVGYAVRAWRIMADYLTKGKGLDEAMEREEVEEYLMGEEKGRP